MSSTNGNLSVDTLTKTAKKLLFLTILKGFFIHKIHSSICIRIDCLYHVHPTANERYTWYVNIGFAPLQKSLNVQREKL